MVIYHPVRNSKHSTERGNSSSTESWQTSGRQGDRSRRPRDSINLNTVEESLSRLARKVNQSVSKGGLGRLLEYTDGVAILTTVGENLGVSSDIDLLHRARQGQEDQAATVNASLTFLIEHDKYDLHDQLGLSRDLYQSLERIPSERRTTPHSDEHGTNNSKGQFRPNARDGADNMSTSGTSIDGPSAAKPSQSKRPGKESSKHSLTKKLLSPRSGVDDAGTVVPMAGGLSLGDQGGDSANSRTNNRLKSPLRSIFGIGSDDDQESRLEELKRPFSPELAHELNSIVRATDDNRIPLSVRQQQRREQRSKWLSYPWPEDLKPVARVAKARMAKDPTTYHRLAEKQLSRAEDATWKEWLILAQVMHIVIAEDQLITRVTSVVKFWKTEFKCGMCHRPRLRGEATTCCRRCDGNYACHEVCNESYNRGWKKDKFCCSCGLLLVEKSAALEIIMRIPIW